MKGNDGAERIVRGAGRMSTRRGRAGHRHASGAAAVLLRYALPQPPAPRTGAAMTRLARALAAFTAFLGLAAPAAGLEPIPDRLVVLTFDDASKSHYTVARPILLK